MSPLNIIIIGATSDMAAAAARIWAAKGASLHLIGRNLAHLEDIAGDLRVRGAGRVACASMDVLDRESHEAVLLKAWDELGRVDVLLFAAGQLPNQSQCEADPSLCRQSLDINFGASAELLLHAANLFEKQRSGVVVIIGSVAGDRGRRGNFIYGAAKAGLETFASGLRVRLAAAGVHVLLIKPGFVATRMTADMRQGALFTSAEVAGKLIVTAVASGGGTVYLPFWWRYIMLVICQIPEFVFKRLKI